ncbi:large conductance mechanosensitive channel protein MscL [Lysinibacillus sphaericus]|uniref:Large-conductance mechanosensitive channel n=1 Tax=Lysinibacillus sphaericus TaxID=1421 RepID=A0A2S0JZE5_LYSSH|nr:large conductance mechanosensitive channel protein MscL [Lysinibacillus sphaericus]AVK96505.1 large-conductance mechanosensitive channel MscL [Lysinibacillus sphaericus]MED4542966.1 large conductance mechanosensitive channel protein MscL [Lysinibacillus sphaericus]TKI19748.1 large conductance mechanosensitive channel protein MscL [Lysinibacillus sphaericus]SUV17702.1 large-conductance mechanosensitive channel [Lysinibacillus sphaericus]GEC81272.1 large-conductance mechanosensitive channel [
MWKDFKEFAMKGNIIDLAIAVVIGGAFGKIVTSLVENIIMPLVGVLTGGIDLTESFMFGSGTAQVKLGIFLQSIIDFLIIAFAIFLALRLMTKFTRKKEEAVVEEPTPLLDAKEELLKEIRDLLKKQQA